MWSWHKPQKANPTAEPFFSPGQLWVFGPMGMPKKVVALKAFPMSHQCDKWCKIFTQFGQASPTFASQSKLAFWVPVRCPRLPEGEQKLSGSVGSLGILRNSSKQICVSELWNLKAKAHVQMRQTVLVMSYTWSPELGLTALGGQSQDLQAEHPEMAREQVGDLATRAASRENAGWFASSRSGDQGVSALHPGFLCSQTCKARWSTCLPGTQFCKKAYGVWVQKKLWENWFGWIQILQKSPDIFKKNEFDEIIELNLPELKQLFPPDVLLPSSCVRVLLMRELMSESLSIQHNILSIVRKFQITGSHRSPHTNLTLRPYFLWTGITAWYAYSQEHLSSVYIYSTIINMWLNCSAKVTGFKGGGSCVPVPNLALKILPPSTKLVFGTPLVHLGENPGLQHCMSVTFISLMLVFPDISRSISYHRMKMFSCYAS